MYRNEGLGVGGGGSLVYWSQDTIHLYSHHLNDISISDDVSIGVSAGDGRGGFSSRKTVHSSSRNFVAIVDGYGRGGYRSHTIHSPSHNQGFYERIFLFRSEETVHFYFFNHG